MAVIKSNVAIADGVYLMEVAWTGEVRPGQFFMVRTWDRDPLLSRPISVHDVADDTLTFLYLVKGRGTQKLARLAPMDTVTLDGPYGNGFPAPETLKGGLTLVGGGIGIAPLYHAAKAFRQLHKHKKIRAYLGFSKEAYRVEVFDKICDEVVVNVGGIITDNVDVKRGETVLSCGPNIMMKSLCGVVPEKHAVYCSLEERMACGMGVCLGCTIRTKNGNRRVCKDGPVFERADLDWSVL